MLIFFLGKPWGSKLHVSIVQKLLKSNSVYFLTIVVGEEDMLTHSLERTFEGTKTTRNQQNTHYDNNSAAQVCNYCVFFRLKKKENWNWSCCLAELNKRSVSGNYYIVTWVLMIIITYFIYILIILIYVFMVARLWKKKIKSWKQSSRSWRRI